MRSVTKELLRAWLTSIGCKDVGGNFYYYRETQYKYWMDFSLVIDIALAPEDRNYIDDDAWANINLSRDVDIRDPSFDPKEFFAPFKDWMDKQ